MIKILLVDDEYHVISHISSLLQQIDFCEINTLKTTFAHEALQIIASSHIDIAFLDINMPKTNGLQIANKIYNQWPDCQIIFLTAYEVFDYIYEANQYPGAIYLLKSESDTKILDTAISCCHTISQRRKEKSYLNDIQRKEKLLLLLQEQQFLREAVRGTITGTWEQFAKNANLDIHFSFKKDIYLMLMHVRSSPSPYFDASFYLEKMEQLLGNLFHFSFVETEKGICLWIFQEKENPEKELAYFDCLKDTMDSFLDICTDIKHQRLSLCLYPEKVAWSLFSRTYQFLYDSYYKESVMLSSHSSVAKVIGENMAYENPEAASDITSHTTQFVWISSMKQALYQGNKELFFTKLQYCRQYCTTIKSMHHVSTISLYFSIVLIYLEYIELHNMETKIAMETALYPLYYINDFPDWEHAFSYLRQLGEIIFRIASKNNTNKTQHLIAAIQNYIQEHLTDNLNLSVIANYVNYNESHISRLFKRHTGNNLSDYITSCRLEYAKVLLEKTDDTVQVISQKAGFHTSQYFSSVFRKSMGVSPNEYRTHKILVQNDKI